MKKINLSIVFSFCLCFASTIYGQRSLKSQLWPTIMADPYMSNGGFFDEIKELYGSDFSVADLGDNDELDIHLAAALANAHLKMLHEEEFQGRPPSIERGLLERAARYLRHEFYEPDVYLDREKII